MASPARSRVRLLLAIGVSAAIVLAAPFLGQLRGWLRAAFPGQFVAIVGAAVALAMATALLMAIGRIRTARGIRYALIAAAAAVAGGYVLLTRTGVPEVDVVERVHFVEYGLIALLFYRAFQPLGVPGVFVAAVPAALTVGTLDEWLQWFIPNRVGEARDVFLNMVAIGCGLAFGAALDPPASLAWRWPAAARHMAAATGCVFLLVFAGFVQAVHLGHIVRDADLAFRSHYDAAALRRLASDRTERWKTAPPDRLRRLSQEDQYLDEGLWHIRERNRLWEAGDHGGASHENEILERYFAPVIDTPSYAAPAPSRWPVAQKDDARQRATPRADFVSKAEPYPIVTVWSGRMWLYWGLIATAAAFVLRSGFDPAGT